MTLLQGTDGGARRTFLTVNLPGYGGYHNEDFGSVCG